MRFHNLQYRPRDKVNKIFIISLCSNRGEDFNFKQTFEFSRLYSERLPAKLTNHSTHTNREIY